LRSSLVNANHRHFGICLGHQLIGLALGGKYVKEAFPRHGVSDEMILPTWSDWGLNGESVTVQFYNSLLVSLGSIESDGNIRTYIHDNRLLLLATKTVFSCQFHPESVGTSYPELFFGGVKKNFL